MGGRVENLGGFFIYSNQPKELADWYEKHFGMKHETFGDSRVYYISFPYTESDGTSRYFVWSIMPPKKELKPDNKYFTINLRVSNIEDLISSLEKNGVEVKPMEEHPEGKFAWCSDADGNAIELWEDVTK